VIKIIDRIAHSLTYLVLVFIPWEFHRQEMGKITSTNSSV